VNGFDVEPAARAAREYGMMCRTYFVGGQREGLPSREMLRQAIREANAGIDIHIRDADYSSLDLRDPARESVDYFSVTQSDGPCEPIL